MVFNPELCYDNYKGSEIMKEIIYLIGFLAFIAIVASIIIVRSMKFKKESNSVVNYDTFMKSFMYKIPLTKAELIQQLSLYNAKDKLEYDFDAENMSITFKKYNDKLDYKVEISEQEQFCIVRLEKAYVSISNTNIPQYINSFMVNKLNAETIPCG